MIFQGHIIGEEPSHQFRIANCVKGGNFHELAEHGQATRFQDTAYFADRRPNLDVVQNVDPHDHVESIVAVLKLLGRLNREMSTIREADLLLLAGLACVAAASELEEQRRFEASARTLLQAELTQHGVALFVGGEPDEIAEHVFRRRCNRSAARARLATVRRLCAPRCSGASGSWAPGSGSLGSLASAAAWAVLIGGAACAVRSTASPGRVGSGAPGGITLGERRVLLLGLGLAVLRATGCRLQDCAVIQR